MRASLLLITSLGLLATSTLAAILFIAPGGPAASGPLRFEPPVIALGDVGVREVREFTVGVHNVSGQAVCLAAVRSGCACTRVRVEKAALEPGDSTVLAGLFRAGADAGPVEEEVVLQVLSPEAAIYRIPVRGRVTRQIAHTPFKLVLQPDFVRSRAAVGEVEFTNSGNQAVEIGAPPPELSGLRVTPAERELAPGNSGRFQVQVDWKEVVARDATLVFRCSHSVERAITVPVAIRPVGGITITPPSIDLGVIARGELTGRIIELHVAGNLLAECESVAVAAPEFLSAAMTDRPEPSRLHLRFSVRPTGRVAALDGNIAIALCHLPTRRDISLTVPVSAFVVR